jgi:hypothetical protein
LAQTIHHAPAPTGIPEIDWQNIQDGLDAMAPGDTLRLAQGNYKIHRPLVFEDWNGNLVGAGREKTVIKATMASNGDLFAVIHQPEWDDYDFPGSQFYGTPVFYVDNAQGLYRVADLTMDVTEIGIAQRSYVLDSGTGAIAFYIDVWENNNQALIVGPLGPEADVIIEDCRFLGSAADQFFGQPNHGIQLAGDWESTIGDYTVRNSEFDGIGTNVVNVIAMHESNIVIKDNVFTDSARPIVLWNNSGCTADILNNEASNILHTSVMVRNIFGLQIPADPCYVIVEGLNVYGGGGVYWNLLRGDTPSVGEFRHNTIRLKPGSFWAGFELFGGASSTLVISHNKVHSEDTFVWGPIFAHNIQDAVIRNNRISGSGPAAAYLGVPFFSSASVTGMTMLGNNFQNWTTEPYFDVDGIAAIWLGTETRGNTIIGGSNKTNVLDEGVDNIITGVNNMGTNLGQDIREAMLLEKEAKSSLTELEALLR